MTKVVSLLLLAGLALAGCSRKEAPAEASPAPAKPAAVSIDAPAPEAAPVETAAAPAPPAPANPGEAAPQAPVVLPPFINVDAKPASSGAEGAPARSGKAANPTAALAALNQCLRSYLSTHQQQLPGTVQDLAAAGLIAAIPDAPAGMAYAIDTARREVVLQKQ